MPLRDDLLNPILGENPSGANLRHDPVADKIKEARREDDPALALKQGEWKTAPKVADYPAVIKMASEALAKRGKDLQIAVWLVDAHIRREGFSSLAPCFHFLHDLLEQFWDTLYPEIDEDGDMEVRAAPLVWLASVTKLPEKGIESLGYLPIVSGKLSWSKYQESRTVGFENAEDPFEKQEKRQAAIREGKISGEEFDAASDATPVQTLRDTYKQLNDGLTALGSLTEFCDEKFADFTPSFIKTHDAIEEIARIVKGILVKRKAFEEEAKPASVDDDFSVIPSADTYSYSEPAAGAGAVPEPGPSVTMSEPPPRIDGADDVGRQLAAICRTLRSRDSEDASPYLILRSYAWARMMYRAPLPPDPPPTPPESDLRVKLKRLTADAEWDKVLELTEANMVRSCGRCWLDMQRYAVRALEGKNLQEVAKCIINQFRILLEMSPDVVDITFDDETPAANQETKDWITTFVIHQKVPPPAKEAESSDSSGSSDSSTDFSDAGGDTSTSDTTSDTSTSDFSLDTTTSTDDLSFDLSAFDTPTTSEPPAPEPAAAPEPEPEPYEVEENPPLLEAEAPPPADTSDEFAMALYAVRDGRTAEGLGMITSLLATERSGRQRFRRRTQLAHLLMAAGKGKVAQPLLDQLVAEIEERRLEEWEPSEAIAYPLELLMHCLTSAEDERRMQLYTRICKLDPVRAVNCAV